MFTLHTPSLAAGKYCSSGTLPPGAMLLISSLPNRPGSLGHHFFTTNKDHREQKLLVIRLAQTQHNDLCAPPETK